MMPVPTVNAGYGPPIGLTMTTGFNMAPIALTTVKKSSLVGPTLRKAAPCPPGSARSNSNPLPTLTERPAPRRPRGMAPCRAARRAARPSSLSG